MAFHIPHINKNHNVALADDEDYDKNEDDQENDTKSTGVDNDSESTGVRHGNKITGADSDNEITDKIRIRKYRTNCQSVQNGTHRGGHSRRRSGYYGTDSATSRD